MKVFSKPFCASKLFQQVGLILCFFSLLLITVKLTYTIDKKEENIIHTKRTIIKRLKTFNLSGAQIRISDIIENFSPLRNLRAFQRLEEEDVGCPKSRFT